MKITLQQLRQVIREEIQRTHEDAGSMPVDPELYEVADDVDEEEHFLQKNAHKKAPTSR